MGWLLLVLWLLSLHTNTTQTWTLELNQLTRYQFPDIITLVQCLTWHCTGRSNLKEDLLQLMELRRSALTNQYCFTGCKECCCSLKAFLTLIVLTIDEMLFISRVPVKLNILNGSSLDGFTSSRQMTWPNPSIEINHLHGQTMKRRAYPQPPCLVLNSGRRAQLTINTQSDSSVDDVHVRSTTAAVEEKSLVKQRSSIILRPRILMIPRATEAHVYQWPMIAR